MQPGAYDISVLSASAREFLDCGVEPPFEVLQFGLASISYVEVWIQTIIWAMIEIDRTCPPAIRAQWLQRVFAEPTRAAVAAVLAAPDSRAQRDTLHDILRDIRDEVVP